MDHISVRGLRYLSGVAPKGVPRAFTSLKPAVMILRNSEINNQWRKRNEDQWAQC